MAGAVPHAIHIRIREFHDKEEDAVKIRKKLPQRKQTEETLKINMHNLRQYSYLKRTNPEMIKDYRGLCSK